MTVHILQCYDLYHAKTMCICFLVRLLTKTLPLCIPRLPPKHILNLQQHPGMATSSLVLRSRARQPKTSLCTRLEVHQVEEHKSQITPCFFKCCGSACARNAVFILCISFFQPTEGSLASMTAQHPHTFAGLIPDTQPFKIMNCIKNQRYSVNKLRSLAFPQNHLS